MCKLGDVFFYLIVASCLFIVANSMNIHFMNPDERVAHRKAIERNAHKQVEARTTVKAKRRDTMIVQVSEDRAVRHCDLAAKKRLFVPSSFDADWNWTAKLVGDKWVINRDFWANSAYSGKMRMNYLCHINTDGSGGALEMTTGRRA